MTKGFKTECHRERSVAIALPSKFTNFAIATATPRNDKTRFTKTVSTSTCVAPRNDKGGEKRAAFTLAEVLITLAIIGVVAAMTIPTLISNYQEKVTVAKVKKSYSMLNNALQLAAIEYGSFHTWFSEDSLGSSDDDGNYVYAESTITNADKFFDIMKKYLKVTSICYASDITCEPPTFYFLHGTKVVSDYPHIGYMNLMDGSTIFKPWAQSSSVCKKDGSNICIDFMIDIDGIEKGVNTYGKDLFSFVITYKAFLPMGTRTMTINQFPYQCKKTVTSSNNGYACTAWVIENGNMDYLHCDDLSWTGKHKCSD